MFITGINYLRCFPSSYYYFLHIFILLPLTAPFISAEDTRYRTIDDDYVSNVTRGIFRLLQFNFSAFSRSLDFTRSLWTSHTETLSSLSSDALEIRYPGASWNMKDEASIFRMNIASVSFLSVSFPPKNRRCPITCKLIRVNVWRASDNERVHATFSEWSTRDRGDPIFKMFRPFTEPVRGRVHGHRTLGQKNVLSKMQRTLGPLGMLYGCMENKNRVRVGQTDWFCPVSVDWYLALH